MESNNIPTIKTEDSGDISAYKKRLTSLTQSGGGSGSLPSNGITKPTSRRGSMVKVKLNDSEDEDDNGDGGNERKRRDSINERIQELLTLVPPEFFNETTNGNEKDIDLAVKNSGTKDGKPNKGQILTKSVEYIQYLQNKIDENNMKEVELLLKLKNLGVTKDNSMRTSAEVALGKIGVGPLSNEYFKNVLVSSANTNKVPPRRGSTS